MKRESILLISLCVFLLGCRVPKNTNTMGGLPENLKKSVEIAIAQIRQAYAPDKRIALFNIQPSGRTKLTVKGETNLPNAKKALLDRLTAQGIDYQDSIQVLPSPEIGEKTYGVVTISVASIRSEPREAAELATQATLGTPVRIWKRQGNWCLVQTPDSYLSWVDVEAVTWMAEATYTNWWNAAKVIYLQPNGYSYTEPLTSAQTVSDLVGGSILRLLSDEGEFWHVAYPDGREAFVAKLEARRYDAWLTSLETTESSLVTTAKKMMGLPYLWGGTSYKAVDCSGFTKIIYFMNGLIIPRDASQQVHTGELVDISAGFGQLRPGDLLFFGRPVTDATPERVTHVGMWIGNNEFIHASSFVRIASVDNTAPNYDDFNLKRLLRVKRILNKPSSHIVQLKQEKIF